jgi:hypothetical protein
MGCSSNPGKPRPATQPVRGRAGGLRSTPAVHQAPRLLQSHLRERAMRTSTRDAATPMGTWPADWIASMITRALLPCQRRKLAQVRQVAGEVLDLADADRRGGPVRAFGYLAHVEASRVVEHVAAPAGSQPPRRLAEHLLSSQVPGTWSWRQRHKPCRCRMRAGETTPPATGREGARLGAAMLPPQYLPGVHGGPGGTGRHRTTARPFPGSGSCDTDDVANLRCARLESRTS